MERQKQSIAGSRSVKGIKPTNTPQARNTAGGQTRPAYLRRLVGPGALAAKTANRQQRVGNQQPTEGQKWRYETQENQA